MTTLLRCGFLRVAALPPLGVRAMFATDMVKAAQAHEAAARAHQAVLDGTGTVLQATLTASQVEGTVSVFVERDIWVCHVQAKRMSLASNSGEASWHQFAVRDHARCAAYLREEAGRP